MTNLRIPGPTPCADEALQEMSRQMINHRGPEFGAMLQRITAGVKKVFETKNDVFILTTSGTGAMETAVVNFLSPGDRVLVVSIGAFGDRFADIAQTFGADVTKLSFDWGTAADPAKLDQALSEGQGYKAMLVTHNETSTGVTNPLAELAAVGRKHDVLVIVDAVSSLSAVPCRVDAWDLDVVVTGSQKGWMVPPALAMISVSDRAWKAYDAAKMPRYYFDVGKAKKYLETNQTPWTPAISVFFALDVALEIMLAEGLENIFARHERVGKLTREGVKALGLEVLADERFASNTVSAVKVPQGVDGKALVKLMREEYDTVLAGGQASLAGKIFRIGHLGLVTEKDITDCLAALKLALPRVGFAPASV
ncbi:MAG: alanine--glyoxylate aminotransferase family protein [Dehalococcoidia bacterium]|nr:alanine--glyoxylate aminotransferase family protein [Dehalococcoidia bacterium]